MEREVLPRVVRQRDPATARLPRALRWPATLLFLIGFGLYAALGLKLAAGFAPVSERVMLFEADTRAVITEMTVFADPALPEAELDRQARHPLFLLFVNPWGSFAARWLSPQIAAVLLNSLIGAGALVLGLFFFFRLTANRGTAVLAALVFGLSASHLVFSAVPESFALATGTMILTFLVALRDQQRGRMNFAVWLGLGVFASGVMITNLVPCALFFAATVGAVEPDRSRRSKAWLGFAAGVPLLSGLLVLVQKMVYPRTFIALLPSGLLDSLEFAGTELWITPAQFPELLRQLFAFSLLAPEPGMISLEHVDVAAMTLARHHGFTAVGGIGLLLWAGMCGVALVRASQRALSPFGWAALASLLFWIVLYSLTGYRERGWIEVFLYSGPPLFLLWAFVVQHGQGRSFRAVVAVLGLCLIAQNGYMLHAVWDRFAVIP